MESNVDSTTINRSHSNLSASDPRNQFIYQKSTFSSQHSSPSLSPMTSFSRTLTPVSSRLSMSQSRFSYSPSNVTTDWSTSDKNESWEYSSPRLRTPESHRGSPYSGSCTPIQPSPNLQSPSVDSILSPSQSFLKPFPPDKIDSDNLLQQYRKVKRDILDDLEKCCKNGKTGKDFKDTTSDKVSVGINTAPDMFATQYEDKGTTVDATILKPGMSLLPLVRYEKPKSKLWPGLAEIIPTSFDTSSSPATLTNPFVSPFRCGFPPTSSSNFVPHTPEVTYASQLNGNQNSTGSDFRQQFLKSESKTSCYQQPSAATSYSNYQVCDFCNYNYLWEY